MNSTLNDILGDPWRCVCPECNCYRINKLVGGKRSHKETFQANGFGKLRADISRQKNWSCDRCGKRLSTVYDRKQEEKVAIESLIQ